MKFILFLICSMFLSIACGGPKATDTNASSTAKRYPLRGKVMSVDKAAKKANIEHDEVAGYMPAMTMDFEVREDWVWEDMKPGSLIRAELVVDNAQGKFWLEKIGIEAASIPGQELPVNDKFAQIGQSVPDFILTDQDGKKVSIKDFSGKALAITFIYSRCPLPEFCVKMSTNFSDVALMAMADPELKDKLRLLSISFDPETDTPAKLRSYGLGYLGKDAKPDFTVWRLAVGKDAEVRKIADFFGLRYELDPNDKTVINHSLRTAVIAPDGKVTKILAGSSWTPEQLLTEMKSASAPPPQ